SMAPASMRRWCACRTEPSPAPAGRANFPRRAGSTHPLDDLRSDLPMNRREFSQSTASVLALSTLGLPLAMPALAQAQASFKEGKDYVRLAKPAPVEAPAGQVEVIEFFWYSCPHCNTFEPTLDAWMKAAPKNLYIRRVPVAFNASFVPQQKLYYALEGMGKLPELHSKVFRAVHVERLPLNKDQAIFDWIAKQGVDAAKFKEVYNSFTVANQVRKATQ